MLSSFKNELPTKLKNTPCPPPSLVINTYVSVIQQHRKKMTEMSQERYFNTCVSIIKQHWKKMAEIPQEHDFNTFDSIIKQCWKDMTENPQEHDILTSKFKIL